MVPRDTNTPCKKIDWFSEDKVIYLQLTEKFEEINRISFLSMIYVSLRLRVQNAVPAQPCVGKLEISLVLLNFLHCNFREWFETP